MCRRSKDDPLAKFFFNRYHLHLLAIPREGAAVGDCYIVTPKGILSPGPIGALMLRGFKMPDIARDEMIAGLSNQVSDAVDLDAGFHLLGPFLAATGLGSMVGDAKASMQSKAISKNFYMVYFDCPSDLDDGLVQEAIQLGTRTRKSSDIG